MQGEQTLLSWLIDAAAYYCKRVWIPNEDGKGPFREELGGAIPRWYVEQEIRRLMEKGMER